MADPVSAGGAAPGTGGRPEGSTTSGVAEVMAPAVAGAEAVGSGADEGPLAVHSWQKSNATLEEVVAALPELRRKASGREAGTRTAVMTLIMVSDTDDDDSTDYVASVRSLGAHHPCRVVLLRPEPDSTPAIDAKYDCQENRARTSSMGSSAINGIKAKECA